MIGLLSQGQAFTSAFRTDSVNSLSEVQRAEVSVLHEFGPGFTGFSNGATDKSVRSATLNS